jgi:hypothetical protein
VAELRRDDDHGQSEMLAFAWDLQSNTRVQTIFIVPHMRDKKGGPVKLVDMRDLYENNANQGARRVRECIFAVVPVWFRNEAEDICRRTLAEGGGKPLAQRVADALARFADLDVLESDLVRRVGRPVEEWTASTVGALVTTYQSLKRGEISREEAFPPHLVTGEEIERQAQPAKPADPPPRLTHEFTPEQAEAAIRADAVARAHAGGHATVPAEKHVWDPDCAICAEQGDATDRAHYYGHTVDFVEDCPACQQEKAWREEQSQ